MKPVFTNNVSPKFASPSLSRPNDSRGNQTDRTPVKKFIVPFVPKKGINQASCESFGK